MAFTQQMRIKLVHVTTLLPANIAFPRIGVRVATLVQKIQSLIGKPYPAENALQTAKRPFTCRPPDGRVRRLFRARGRDRPVRGRGVFSRGALRVLIRGSGPAPRRGRASGHDFPFQVLPQQALQGGDFYERTQAARCRRLQLHAAR